METTYVKKTASLVILAGLIILAYLLLKPILMSIILAIVLAFIFTPVHKRLVKRVKYDWLSVTLITAFLVLIIVVPIWIFAPLLLKEVLHIYSASQNIDLTTPLKTLFPSLFSNQQISSTLLSSIYSFITNLANGATKAITNFILSFPTLLLQFLVVLFTFFFVLRDGKIFVSYIQSLLPFSKDVEKKLFKSSRDITISILYGQVVIGIFEGILAGISFFIFGLNNALFLMILAILAGIFPIIGTGVIWIPVTIYLLFAGHLWSAIGILLFGIVGVFIENALKPTFVSKRTNMHSGVILLGMVGGIFAFGLMGIILGPLILAYLLIVLEIYRDKRTPGFLQNPDSTEVKNGVKS